MKLKHQFVEQAAPLVMDKYLVKTVVEDLEYLRNEWGSDVEDATLRRGSVILRRLIVQGELFKVWRELELDGKPKVTAPRVEYFLTPANKKRIVFVVAGGGKYQGLEIALVILNRGSAPIEAPPDANPQEHEFSLAKFARSTSIYVKGVKIRRQEIIQYVANKLGGAHVDHRRRGKLAKKFEALDESIGLFQVQGAPEISGKNSVYFELLSIGQLLAHSKSMDRLIRTARSKLGL